jgi:hypothetical protein
LAENVYLLNEGRERRQLKDRSLRIKRITISRQKSQKEGRMKKTIFIISLALAVAFVLSPVAVQSQPGRGGYGYGMGPGYGYGMGPGMMGGVAGGGYPFKAAGTQKHGMGSETKRNSDTGETIPYPVSGGSGKIQRLYALHDGHSPGRESYPVDRATV